jgi:two-component system LytT family response regulator
MRMRILIVDDESAARVRLASLLEEIDADGTEIVGEAADGVSALELARTHRPDLVLLDISMPEVDGFDVARHLPDPRPLIIFQTAYAEYALQAFDHQALDYVVKPVSRARLAQALERARARLTAADSPRAWDSGSLERLGSALGYHRARSQRVLVRAGSAHRLVPLAEVSRFAAGDGVVYAHTAAGQPITDYTLSELEQRTSGFVRVSRADLVNIAFIERIRSNGDGSATLELRGGARVRVSRRRAADVRRTLEF